MSLARLWLRTLAIAALSPQTTDSNPPTIAGDRVFDSRLDPLQFSTDEKEIPAIAVYTGDDDGAVINRGAHGGPFRRNIELQIELTIGSFDSTLQSGQLSYVLPVTDAQLEARLDLFEQQVKWALMGYTHRPVTNAFLAYVVRVNSIHSTVQRDEANNRFASRVLTLSCELKDDCSPFYIGVKPAQTDLDLSQFAGYPWLGQMLETLHSDPSMMPVIDALEGNLNSAVLVPLLKRIGFKADFIEPYDRNLVPGAPNRGPDGTVDHTFIMETK